MIRGRLPTRRLDAELLRTLLGDGRAWLRMGVVRAPPGSPHFEVVVEGGRPVDVLVDVEIAPHGTPVLCRLGAVLGGPGLGLWGIPPEGSEVLVLVPEGELDWMPTILGCASSNEVPDGVSESVFVLAVPPGGRLVIHDGEAGDADPLVRRSEFESHVHVAPGGATETPTAPITGTSTLRAK